MVVRMIDRAVERANPSLLPDPRNPQTAAKSAALSALHCTAVKSNIYCSTLDNACDEVQCISMLQNLLHFSFSDIVQ